MPKDGPLKFSSGFSNTCSAAGPGAPGLSHSQNGIEIQAYCAIIACLLISLWTGRKPTLRTYEMICFYFCGLATEAELLAHLDKLKRKDDDDARQATAKQK